MSDIFENHSFHRSGFAVFTLKSIILWSSHEYISSIYISKQIGIW